MMAHIHSLSGKEETLLSIIDTNDLLLARLCDYMHESTEQEIKAETTSYGRNRRLLNWVRQSSAEGFDAFVLSLRLNGQAHVANFIIGTPGEMPLRDDVRKRLRRIKGTLINMLYTNSELLDYLIGERVISEADSQNIGAEATLNQKNAKLVEIIMRGSERNLQCFKDVLTFVGQGHVVKYMEKGEVLPIHIQFTDDKASPEREESILATLRKLVSVVPENWIDEIMPVELSDDQRKILVDSLRNLKAVIVGAHLTQSIMMYVYCSTLPVLESVWALFQSAQLKDILETICQCLSNDDTCTVVVSVSQEDYVPCKEELSSTNYEEKTIVNQLLTKPRQRMKATSTSEPVSYQGILTMQEEICQLRTQVDELIRRRQQTEMALSAVKHCLLTVESDVQLSSSNLALVNEAKLYIEQCFEGGSDYQDIESTVNWVQHQDYQICHEDVVDKFPVSYEAVSDGICASYDDDSLSVDTGYKSYKTHSMLTSSLQSQVPFYAMNSTKRGKFIVISNKTFSLTSSLPTRQGAGRDADMLCSVFSQLGFEVCVHLDQTAADMCAIMSAAAPENDQDCDCFAAAILSHGDGDNQIYGVDGKALAINRLTDPIKDCLALAGKPKIFFFEASRGRFDASGDIDEEADTPSNLRIPLEADVLYAFSTAEGYFSFRNPLRGSWFTQTLCDELRDMAMSGAVDLERVLSKVRHRIACTLLSNSSGMRGRKQVPSVYSTLTKRLSFVARD